MPPLPGGSPDRAHASTWPTARQAAARLGEYGKARKARPAKTSRTEAAKRAPDDDVRNVSTAARDLEGYIEQALEGASRIRVWLIDNKSAPDEARKLYGKATEMFDAISCLARGGADRTGE